MIFSEASDVFCDALSVTFSPDNSPLFGLGSFLLSTGLCKVGEATKADSCYLFSNGGYVLIWANRRFEKVYFSGRSIEVLRTSDLWGETLSLLSECPHNVTRLDAAQDVPEPYHLVRERLVAEFPDYRVPLGRKSLQSQEKYFTIRADGNPTSTYEIGQRGSGKQMVRIYDKQNEVLEKQGEMVPPLTRVELEVAREFNATLRDALDPTAIFYHVLGGLIFPTPHHVPSWVSVPEFTWSAGRRPPADPYRQIKRLVEESDDLRTLVALSQKAHSGGIESTVAVVAAHLRDSFELLLADSA